MTGYDLIAELLGKWSFGISARTILFRVLLAVVLAALIGWERSAKRHAAGLRTFIMIGMASNAAAMADAWLMETREVRLPVITAAVVVGASMISVYTILFSSRNQIRGLTTSAGLWTCGIAGLSVGLGFYTAGVIVTIVMLLCLSVLPLFERYLKDRSNHFEVHLELESSRELKQFVSTIRKLGMKIDEIEFNPAYLDSGLSVYSVSFSIRSQELKKYKKHAEIIEALRSLDYVSHIEEMN
ncbi:MAG: MgtC/SapB family protein [Eubacterium sp.]|nr:MgtC/SapB family protein [Eubacterium sp.]MBR0397060.1 MgtC/SapB family protein [Eubacterium sp.]